MRTRSPLTLSSKMNRHCSGLGTIFQQHNSGTERKRFLVVVVDFQMGVASICTPLIPPTVTELDSTAAKSGSDLTQDRKSVGKAIRCPSMGSASCASLTM